MSNQPPVVAPTPPAPAHTPGDNVPVNILRAVAALAVVAEHSREVLMQDFDDVPHTAVETGLYGVSALGHQAVVVFFVLSGYWVGGSALRRFHRRTFRFDSYSIDRVTRLWIVLIPALLLTLGLDLVGRSFYGDMTTYTGDPGYAGTVLAGVLTPTAFFGDIAFLGAIRTPVFGSNAALWSLGYEFWMYLLVPLVVFAVLRRSRRSLLYLLIALLCAFIVGPDVLWYTPIWGAGMLIAALEPRLRRRLGGLVGPGLSAVRVLAALLLLGVALVVRGLNSFSPLEADYLVAIPAALLLMTLVTGSQRAPRRFRVAARFSDLAASSYSLYAIHVPMLILLASILGLQVDSRWPADSLHWFLLLLCVIGCVVVAHFFAKVTEGHTDAVRTTVKRALLRRRNDAQLPSRATGSTDVSR